MRFDPNQIETKKMIYDRLHPSNPIFKFKHRIGDKLYGPGDPNCSMCKGTGITFELKCSCQENYLYTLMSFAKDNGLKIDFYYNEVPEPNKKFDLNIEELLKKK